MSWLVENEKNQDPKNKEKKYTEDRNNEEEDEEDEDEDTSDNYFPFREEGSQNDATGQPPESSKQGENRCKQQGGVREELEEPSAETKKTEQSNQVHVGDKTVDNLMELVEEMAEGQSEIAMDSEEPLFMQSQNSEQMAGVGQYTMEETEKVKASTGHNTFPNQTKGQPIQATRKSPRIIDSGTPVQEKAEKLKDRKNNTGTSHNPFTILQSCSNSHFTQVVSDCDLILEDANLSIDEFIESLKAKELAQAEILRLTKAAESNTEQVIVEENSDDDDEMIPEGHAVLVEELTKISEELPVSPSLEKASKGKKKVKFK